MSPLSRVGCVAFRALHLIALACLLPPAAAERLPGLNADLSGYMAVQFHVAHFASVMGAGVLAAGRGMLSLDHGISCASTASPYINDCHFDAAGQLLQQVYGPVKPPRPIVRHG